MIILIKLIVAHFIGDFVLQPNSWVADKEAKKEKSVKLYLHIGVHVILMVGLTMQVDLIKYILLIGLLHYIIDLCKLSLQERYDRVILFILDQLIHVIIILLIVDGYNNCINVGVIDMKRVWVIILSILLLTNVSAQIMKVLISKWTPETEDDDHDSLKNAGKYIGVLERVFIFGFVIFHNIEAIGFLLAAKSVFRFGDLKESKDRKLTEYILIGTLLSFGLAILIGLMYLELIRMIE